MDKRYKAIKKGIMIFVVLLGVNSIFNSISSGLGFGYPYSTFLFAPDDRFADFFKYIGSLPGPVIPGWSMIPKYGINPYVSYGDITANKISNQHVMPLTMLLMLIFRYLMVILHPVILYSLIIIQICILYYKALYDIVGSLVLRRYLMLFSLISYPAIFCITRGNIPAALVALCLVIFMKNNAYGRKDMLKLALMIAIAINFRPNSVIFLVLLFSGASDRIFTAKAVMLSAITATLIGITSYLLDNILYETYDLKAIILSIKYYNDIYSASVSGFSYGSSLTGAIRFIALLFNTHISAWVPLVSSLTLLILMIKPCVVLMGKDDCQLVVAYIVCTAYILCAPVMSDYHLLVYLFFVFSYAEIKADNLEIGKIGSMIMLTSCLVLAPKNEIFINGVSIQVLVNPLALLLSLIYIFLNIKDAQDDRNRLTS